MDVAQRRFELLLSWRDEVRRAEQRPVPSPQDLKVIADSRGTWPATEAGRLQPWRPTIEWILQRFDEGSRDPVGSLPSWLRRPQAPHADQAPVEAEVTSGAEHPAAPAAPPVDARAPAQPPAAHDATTSGGEDADPAHITAIGALRSWRDKNKERRMVGFSGFKDAQIVRIVRSGFTSVDEIANALPADLRSYAEDVARIVSEVRATAIGARPSGDATPDAAEMSVDAGEAATTGPTEPGATVPQMPQMPQMPGMPEMPKTPVPETSAPATLVPETPPPGTLLPGASAPGAPEAANPQPGTPEPLRQTPLPGRQTTENRVPDAVDEQSEESHAGWDPDAFVPFDLTVPVGDPAPLRVVQARDGGWTLSWPSAPQSPTVVYRVVSGDYYEPYAPESADLIAITESTRAHDSRPFATAVRHFQVWCNAGETVDDALNAQPSLHAHAVVVSPVMDLNVREDGGRVVGQWHVFDDTQRVQVCRIPVEKARTAVREEYRILADRDNLGGFVDAEVTRGARYLYEISAEARVEGVTRLSPASRVEVTVSAVLAPVGDLVARPLQSGSERVFELEWTAPSAGRVEVYRSTQPPVAGARSEPRPEAALPQMGLRREDKLPQPIERHADGRAGMTGVAWPHGWMRAYFTPVTVLNGTVHVGTTASVAWVPPVQSPRLVERVGRQIVTFEWPPGAAVVKLYLAPRDADASAALSGESTEISEREYRELGGVTFAGRLPWNGCRIFLVPVAFAAAAAIKGDPVHVDYPGLLRLTYRIETRRNVFGKPAQLTVAIISEVDLNGSPAFVLVHNPDRLPISISDGTPVPVVREDDPTLVPTARPRPARLEAAEPSRWRADVREMVGFVRLFVDLPPQRLATVALLDPPVRDLLLQPKFGRR